LNSALIVLRIYLFYLSILRLLEFISKIVLLLCLNTKASISGIYNIAQTNLAIVNEPLDAETFTDAIAVKYTIVKIAFRQGTLTDGEVPVQLTSSLRQLFLAKNVNIYFLNLKIN